MLQIQASQRNVLSGVNQGFQDEKENGNGSRVFQPLQEVSFHSPGTISFLSNKR